MVTSRICISKNGSTFFRRFLAAAINTFTWASGLEGIRGRAYIGLSLSQEHASRRTPNLLHESDRPGTKSSIDNCRRRATGWKERGCREHVCGRKINSFGNWSYGEERSRARSLEYVLATALGAITAIESDQYADPVGYESAKDAGGGSWAQAPGITESQAGADMAPASCRESKGVRNLRFGALNENYSRERVVCVP